MAKDYPRRALSDDSVFTDMWILQMFAGWFDPCPFVPGWSKGKHVDGLTLDWPDRTYVNPPYSSPLDWVKKAIKTSRAGKTIVLLLKHDSSTEWYRLLHEAGAHFLLITGRLKHQTDKPAAFPSLLAVLPSCNLPDGQTTLKEWREEE